jgi:hypothetical protein
LDDTGGKFVSRNDFNRSGTLCSAMALMFSRACSALENAMKAFSLQMRLKASASAIAARSSGVSDATSSYSTTSKRA